jgi:hypothetical protein
VHSIGWAAVPEIDPDERKPERDNVTVGVSQRGDNKWKALRPEPSRSPRYGASSATVRSPELVAITGERLGSGWTDVVEAQPPRRSTNRSSRTAKRVGSNQGRASIDSLRYDRRDGSPSTRTYPIRTIA